MKITELIKEFVTHMDQRGKGGLWRRDLPGKDDYEIKAIRLIEQYCLNEGIIVADISAAAPPTDPAVRVLSAIYAAFVDFVEELSYAPANWISASTLGHLYLDMKLSGDILSVDQAKDMGIDSIAREHLKSVKHLKIDPARVNTDSFAKLTDEHGGRGTAVPIWPDEEKHFNPDDPESTIIEVTVKTDSRQSGQSRLAHAIARSIAGLGYANVSITSFQQPGWEDNLMQEAIPEMEAALKKVRVLVDDVAHPNVPRMTYDIEPSSTTGSEQYTKMHEANPTANRYGSQQIIIHTQPDEPFFVLLGRDPQAPDLVDQWAADRNQMEMGNSKVTQAMDIATMMRQFKAANPDLGMSQNLYQETLDKELMYLVPRTVPYNEDEILKMAMVITEAAVLSGIELNVRHNTCFTHEGVQQPVEQQIGQVTRIAQAAGKEVVVLLLDQHGITEMAWGDPGYIRTLVGSAKADEMEIFRAGEYPDSAEQEALEIPGLNVMDRNLDEFPDRDPD